MARRTKTIEIDEELFVRKETAAIRLEPGQEPYSVWNCAIAPDEKIRVNDGEVLRFRNGLLECRDEADDAVVANANKYASNRYVRGDKSIDPFTYTEKKSRRVTKWYSKAAYEQYVALHPNTN